MRTRIITLLKVTVTLLGLALILRKVPIAEISQTLSGVRWSWLVLAFGLVAAGLVLRAYRWQLLLQGLGASVRFRRLVELYLVGNFFNAFLPSGFGGDAVRAVEATRDVSPDMAAGTVIVDRLTGLLMLLFMALVALPFRPADFPSDLGAVLVAVSISGLIGGFILLEGNLLAGLGRWLPSVLSTQGSGPIAKLLRAIRGCGRRAILGALLVSTAFNLLLVGWWAATGHALGLDVPFSYYLLVVPLMSVALLFPSVGGLGVREYLAPLLFAGAKVPGASAVALSLLVFAIMRLASLLGGPIYLRASIRQNRAESATTT